MPEKSSSRTKLTPPGGPAPGITLPWVEPQITSNFSFLRGASHPEELVFEAYRLGFRAVAITDLNTLAGVVRAHSAAKNTGIRFIAGARLSLFSAFDEHESPDELSMISVLAYPMSWEGYGRLCSILTTGKRRALGGGCYLTVVDFLDNAKDIACVLIPPQIDSLQKEKHLLVPDFLKSEACIAPDVTREFICNPKHDTFFESALQRFRDGVPREALSVAFSRSYEGIPSGRLEAIKETAGRLRIPLMAVNDILYHAPERKPLQDVLTCIRNKCTVRDAGFLLSKNSDHHLKKVEEIFRIYRNEPEAVKRAVDLEALTAGFSLDLLRYEYPDEICPAGKSPFEHLKDLAWQGARERYPEGVSEKVAGLLDQEFSLIRELQYEKYFLTCHDIVRYARSLGILCQGRGAAANSAVCYCLGITSVDPERIDILFARFVSKERNEPPDIDIDFEHERREEVIQYIYSKYGRHRAGLTAEVITYRNRSAVRDVGKALGLSLEVVDRLAKGIHRWTACEVPFEAITELGLDPRDVTLQNTLILSRELLGFPRHISQHVGGFIISLHPLSETVPILNAGMPDRTIIEWDKDDIDALGMLKIDVLGLGMLSCIRKALAYINTRRSEGSQRPLYLHTIPPEDSRVYDMICESDTVGVFQIESRAQMSMLPRLRPRCFYDLVIEVAIVRPGPIHGNMVHPYLKRRAGLEPVHFPDEEVKSILGKTLGVPLFQEQAMRLAIVLAKFSPGEAEKLRRAMAAWKKNKSLIESFKERIVKGMRDKGYSEEFAETCVNQIKGFSEYGFPESHAASFALLVYASAWIKRHYPIEFAAALLNSQPMGFYEPSQIVRDLEAHGRRVLPVDVNFSGWDSSVEKGRPWQPEEGDSLRLGLRLVNGLKEDQGRLVASLREGQGHVSSIRELWLRAFEKDLSLRKSALVQLAKADAFASLGVSRREALWEIKGLPEKVLPLDPFDTKLAKSGVELPQMPLQQSMFEDYKMTGLSLKAHPVSFLRKKLEARRAFSAAELRSMKKGAGKIHVSAAGLAIVRQRPVTAKGAIFVTLEDETGTFNLIVRPKVFEEYNNIVLSSSFILAQGLFEKVGNLPYINVYRLESLDGLIQSEDAPLPSRSYSY